MAQAPCRCVAPASTPASILVSTSDRVIDVIEHAHTQEQTHTHKHTHTHTHTQLVSASDQKVAAWTERRCPKVLTSHPSRLEHSVRGTERRPEGERQRNQRKNATITMANRMECRAEAEARRRAPMEMTEGTDAEAVRRARGTLCKNHHNSSWVKERGLSL